MTATTPPIDLATASYIDIAEYLHTLSHADLAHVAALAVFYAQPRQGMQSNTKDQYFAGYAHGQADTLRVTLETVRRALPK